MTDAATNAAALATITETLEHYRHCNKALPEPVARTILEDLAEKGFTLSRGEATDARLLQRD